MLLKYCTSVLLLLLSEFVVAGCGRLKLCLRLLLCYVSVGVFFQMCLCICVYLHMEARGHRIPSSIILPTHFWRHGLLLNQKLCWLARIAKEKAPGVLLSLPSWHWDHRHEPPDLDLTRILGIKNRSLCLCGNYFTDWVISPGFHSSYLVKVHSP